MKQFYILSTGRCGTTFLSKLIRANDASLEDMHQLSDSKWLNVRANVALSNRGSRERFTSSLARKYNNTLPPSSADPLRSVAYYFYLKKLFVEQPDPGSKAVIIHLVRDPRDFVASFMNWKDRKLSGKVAHHLTPFWMPEPRFRSRISMSKFEHFCWVWMRKNQLFHEGLSDLPNYHLFKMEDLRPDSEALQDLLSLIFGEGEHVTKIEGRSHNATIKKDFPYWNSWEPEQAKKLLQICSAQMEQYSYGEEMAWRALINHP